MRQRRRVSAGVGEGGGGGVAEVRCWVDANGAGGRIVVAHAW